MQIRVKHMNIWKWLVLGWTAHKAIRVGRALIKARRLAKKKVRLDIANRYADL